MFIKVNTNQGNEVDLNTSQICYIDGQHIMMANTFTLFLNEAGMKKVYECLYGEAAEPNSKVAEKTAEMLTELYKLCGGKGEAKATSDRKARLKTRMKDFSFEDLKIAAKNLGEDAFMQGENDRNKRFGTLDYLLRTSANVNKWIETEAEAPKKPKMF